MPHLAWAIPLVGQALSGMFQNKENKTAQANNDNQRTIARGMAGADWSKALADYNAYMAQHPAPYANASVMPPPPGMPAQGPQLAQIAPKPVANAAPGSNVPPGLAQLIAQSTQQKPPVAA